jgi:hypothetical protein
MAHPPPPNHVGDVIETKHPDGSSRRHIIVDEIHIYQTGTKKKLIYLQRIKRHRGKEEFRLGYFIIGKKPRMCGRWVWGQYATFLPASDLKRIIRMARGKGWL